MDKAKILIVEDDARLASGEKELVVRLGHEATVVNSAEEARLLIADHFFDLLLLDEGLGGMTGSELLRECRQTDPDIAAIMITGHGDLETAISALRLGAIDFLRKPVSGEVLCSAIQRALDDSLLQRHSRFVHYKGQRPQEFSDIVGNSPALNEVLNLATKIIATDTTVLVEGECGTGKELVARAIHFQGARSQFPFVPVNAACIPSPLLESTLFGHRKGAFTDAKGDRAGLFEAASKGTIFLDEIGEMPFELQKALLRVLQEKKILRVGDTRETSVDVRVVAATNRNLKREVDSGRFRSDLYYRLTPITIKMPALRDRVEDIPILAMHFVNKYRLVIGKPITGIEQAALEKLKSYSWPGNIRELENVLQGAIIRSSGGKLTADLIFFDESQPLSANGETLAPSFKEAKRRFEQKYFRDLLARAGGNKSRAAEMAKIDRPTLYEYLEKAGLHEKE